MTLHCPLQMCGTLTDQRRKLGILSGKFGFRYVGISTKHGKNLAKTQEKYKALVSTVLELASTLQFSMHSKLNLTYQVKLFQPVLLGLGGISFTLDFIRTVLVL